jgi:hypothetical protein
MDNQIVRVINALCDDVGTPIASTVKQLVRDGKWLELQRLKVRPHDYRDSESFFKDTLVVDLLRKCDLPTTVDKKAVAVATFWSCEQKNATTNARLTSYLPESFLIEDLRDMDVVRFIDEWRKDVSFTMGNLPDHLTPRFSGGATYADTGFYKTTPDKMSSRPTITAGARCLLPQWGWTSWCKALIEERSYQSDPRTVRGNIFFTVPKDGKTFRGCAKEPSINITYQLDVGRVLKDALLHRLNIDLRGGQSVHRDLACQASVDGLNATIDMSNASDLTSRVLPKLVLRRDWWELLDSLRSTHTRVNGKWVRLEKFSSMGNGFTFELETVIFATLARTVIRLEGGDPGVVKCYGDDLIVPVVHYRGVMAALAFFGYTPNMDKTFAEGPFRESCGGDYWDGIPVRGHYLEELPDEPHKWIALANGLRRVGRSHPDRDLRWSYVRRAWLRAMDPIPSAIRRCKGPEHLGDIVLHDDPEFWTYVEPPRGHEKSWDARYVQCWRPIPVVLPWHHWLPSVQLAACTLGLPSDGVTPRDGVEGYRIAKVCANISSSWLPSMKSPKVIRRFTDEPVVL